MLFAAYLASVTHPNFFGRGDSLLPASAAGACSPHISELLTSGYDHVHHAPRNKSRETVYMERPVEHYLHETALVADSLQIELGDRFESCHALRSSSARCISLLLFDQHDETERGTGESETGPTNEKAGILLATWLRNGSAREERVRNWSFQAGERAGEAEFSTRLAAGSCCEVWMRLGGRAG